MPNFLKFYPPPSDMSRGSLGEERWIGSRDTKRDPWGSSKLPSFERHGLAPWLAERLGSCESLTPVVKLSRPRRGEP